MDNNKTIFNDLIAQFYSQLECHFLPKEAKLEFSLSIIEKLISIRIKEINNFKRYIEKMDSVRNFLVKSASSSSGLF